VAVAALVLAGCGVPPDDQATLAAPASVPFDLLGQSPSVTATSLPFAQTEKATLFLVQGERLAPVQRELPAPVSVESVLEALASGPTTTEVQLGLRTALLTTPGLVNSGGVSGGIATIDLGQPFTEIAGRDQIVALAQIVSTVTGLPGVGRVRFTLDGNPVGILRGDGAVTTETVSRDDYATLAPVPLG
ncbi:MAG TPA: GerMN domain-containing protein, partial [Acidimicrobiia bacterium]|jgi:spore germination protein GerM|nr:GerMN domain-containing protein [Acidimicrobiia bacterium]